MFDKKENEKVIQVMKKLGNGSMKVFMLLAVDTFIKNKKLKLELKVAKTTTLVLTAISTGLGIKLHKEHEKESDANLEIIKNAISKMSEEDVEKLVEKILSENKD